MGDPFSVAGTAVGITSLGIQTCQILYQYYSNVKGIHEDIDDVLRRVEGLQGILDSLKDVKARFEIDNHEPSSQLHMALKACEDVLKRLKKLADSCKATKEPQRLEDRLRSAKRRAMWPFKKETVTELQATLDGFQQNLSLALQSAGLNALVQKFDSQWAALDALQDQLIGIEGHQDQQTVALQTIQCTLTNGSIRQEQHEHRTSSELSNILSELSLVKENLSLMVSNNGQFRNPYQTPPSLLAETTQALEALAPQIQQSVQLQSPYIRQNHPKAGSATLSLVCSCRPKKKQSLTHRGWVAFFSEEVYQHRSDCPYFSYADYSRSVAAEFRVYNRLVGLCVQFGWQRSRQGGWDTIAPILRYRAVVPLDSPAFKLLRDTEIRIFRISSSSLRSQKAMTDILVTTSNSLQQCFGKDARPTDLNEYGFGIFHDVLALIAVYIKYGFHDWNTLCLFIDKCMAQGIPCDQTNFQGLTPIKYWQLITCGRATAQNASTYRSVLHHLARKLDHWSVVKAEVHGHNGNSKILYEIVSDTLRHAEMNANLDEDDPLLCSILRRSEADFRSHIIAVSVESLTSKLEERKYSVPLASWPQGLETILSSIVCKSSHILGDRLLKEACYSAGPISWEVFLHHEIQLTSENWGTLCQRCVQMGWICRTYDQCYLKALFFTMAVKLMPCNTVSLYDLETLPLDKDKAITVPVHICLYNTGCAPVVAAESAWDAGHRGVDQPGHIPGYGSGYFGTPLWTAATSTWHGGWKEDRWLYPKWLLDHGADPTWSHPEYRTTTAHCVGRLAVHVKCVKNQLVSLSDVQNLWTMEHTDDCTCYCSREGCLVIACATSKYSMSRWQCDWINYGSYHRQTIRPYFYALVDRFRSATWISSSILRILTFEELSLTHTCCYQIFDEVQGHFTRPTSDEAKVIHKTEQKDLHLLDDLMMEFETGWLGYTKSFAKFTKRVWQPRMRAVRRGQHVDQEVELRKLDVTLRKKVRQSKYDVYVSESDMSESEGSTDSEGSGYRTADDGHELDNVHDGAQEDAIAIHENAVVLN